MNVRRSSPPSTRPQTTSTTGLLLQTSTAGWYAEWKARKNAAAAAPTPTAEPETPAGDDAAAALARWLTGGK